MAILDAYKNLALAQVLIAPSPPTTGTSLTLVAGQAAWLPTPPFNATVFAGATFPTPANAEIIRVTAIAGNVATLVRAQEGSTARAIGANDYVAGTFTTKFVTDVTDSTNQATGILPDARLSANVPRLTAANVFTADQFIQKSGASVRLVDTNGAANQRLWVMGCDLAPDFYLQSRDDAGNITANAAIFRRTGDVEVGKDVYEKGRLTPLGHWIAVPYHPAAFHSDAGTWSVPSGAVVQNVYTLLGKLMIWGIQINAATLAGAGLYLLIDLPLGLTLASVLALPVGTATEGAGVPIDAMTMAVGASLAVRKASATAWLDSAGLNYLYLTAVIQLA